MRLRQSTQQSDDESGGLVSSVRGAVEDRTGDESTADTTDGPQGWFARARAKYGLGAVLVVAGIALVVFPEPVTSTAGFVLIGVGAVIWIASWARS